MFFAWVSPTADILTIVAALIAIFGLAATWFSRPRVTVSTMNSQSDSATIFVVHRSGANAAQHFFKGFGALNSEGYAVFGHGAEPWFESLVPGDSRALTFFDPAQVFYSGDPWIGETRTALGPEFGFIVDISWPRQMLPWLRHSRVVVWTLENRRAGLPPAVLKGRKARSVYRKAMKPPA